ncbi:MAG: class I SAM-dependent RNA methyltransferase, partial [Pedobacter sp.]
MNVFTRVAAITVTCHKRLAPYLEQEIKELGFQVEETFVTGVKVRGTVTDCIRLNLSLRCASQVLYSLGSFRAMNADHIYNELKNFAWEEIIPDPGYFSVTSNVMNDTINNNMFANLRVKDAIVDRLRDQRGVRPSTGAELIGTVIH